MYYGRRRPPDVADLSENGVCVYIHAYKYRDFRSTFLGEFELTFSVRLQLSPIQRKFELLSLPRMVWTRFTVGFGRRQSRERRK